MKRTSAYAFWATQALKLVSAGAFILSVMPVCSALRRQYSPSLASASSPHNPDKSPIVL
jgi:hypothetical protein